MISSPYEARRNHRGGAVHKPVASAWGARWACEPHLYKYSKNSSGVTFACLKILRNVPIASSLCEGTTQVNSPFSTCFFKITWLPRCLTRVKPKRSRARLVSSPERRDNLGGIIYLKCSKQCALNIG